jgi:hypothetical protein
MGIMATEPELIQILDMGQLFQADGQWHHIGHGIEVMATLDMWAGTFYIRAQNNGSDKWLCPQCGSMGVSGPERAPLCHRPGCDYQVTMVNISDLVYNKIGHDRWKAGAFDRSHGLGLLGSDLQPSSTRSPEGTTIPCET